MTCKWVAGYSEVAPVTFKPLEIFLLVKTGCITRSICFPRSFNNKGLLLHYQSNVDNRYKRSLIRTMLDRAKRLSSSPDLFSKECYDLRKMFLKLKYPVKLIDSIFMRFHASQDLNQSCIEPIDSPVLITLPFKDQKSADSVRKQYNCITKCNLSLTIVYITFTILL